MHYSFGGQPYNTYNHIHLCIYIANVGYNVGIALYFLKYDLGYFVSYV